MATQKISLINDVKRLVQSYHETRENGVNKDKDDVVVDREVKVNDNRKKGCDELFEHIKNLIPDKVKQYAGYGRNEARVLEFKFKDDFKFGNCYAKDLLTKGDVITRLQAYLDAEHSDEAGSAFFVYFTHIGRYQTDHSENKFGVFVNWDKESWSSIKERLSQKTLRVNSHDESNMERPPRDGGRGLRGRSRDVESDRSRAHMRGRGRGRGNYRGGSRNFQNVGDSHSVPEVVSVQAPSSAKDDLPESHNE